MTVYSEIRNAEILEWASANDIVETLEVAGISQTAADAALEAEQHDRKTIIRSAISERATAIVTELDTQIAKLTSERELAAPLSDDNKRELKVNQNYYPDHRLASLEFSPFSIITRGLKDCENNNAVYIPIRNLVESTLFPEIESTRETRTLAGRAIRPLVALTPCRLQRFDWHINHMQKLLEAGIRVHPGQGISFEDPNLVREKLENTPFSSRAFGSTATTLFLNFASRHTDSK